MFEPYFCVSNDPFTTVEWSKRNVEIVDLKENGSLRKIVVDAPDSWSDNAVKIFAGKYFYGRDGDDVVEKSIKDVIHRMARTIADWGKEDGYFKTKDDSDIFYREIAWLCLHQYGLFNSPMMFNCGLHKTYGIKDKRKKSSFWHWDTKKKTIVKTSDLYQYPQVSACYILDIEDNMESIMDVAKTEAMVFKFGSGSGVNNSSLRSKRETLSGGGHASGPLSFMRIRDQVALVVESGGKTRRAAKLECLNIDHPDVVDFIEAKAKEEKKAEHLRNMGYDGGMDGEAYRTVMYQNSNFSVRLTDNFMKAYEEDGEITTRAVTTGKVIDTYKAKDLMKKIVDGCYVCGDPGAQFDTTTNNWNTVPNFARIDSTNPCGEYAAPSGACNLASLNIIKFLEDGVFNIDRFQQAVSLFIVAQDVVVDRASYPDKKVAKNTHSLRALGLGYTNLGAALMRLGFPYDSSKGRDFASSITSLMTSRAFLVSARLAETKGSFVEYENNKRPMKKVLRRHKSYNDDLIKKGCMFDYIIQDADRNWKSVVASKGFRNSQVTLLAPTGTISIVMDCDTFSGEPEYELVKEKKLSGGGTMIMINNSIETSLTNLGYSTDEVISVVDYIKNNKTIVGAPELKEKHLSIFDCAVGKRPISYWGHLKMLAAIQPFLSGAISKTINAPYDITKEEMENIYYQAWKMGLKSVTVFRDGCKESPLGTAIQKRMKPRRYKLSETCKTIRHRFEINGHSGYLHIGLFEDGSPGEIFIRMHKQGSTVCGLMDAFGISTSMMLQYGIPLEELISKFSFMKFDPSGWTPNKDVKVAKSPIDYIFRWLESQFCDKKNISVPVEFDQEDVSLKMVAEKSKEDLKKITNMQVCSVCGNYPLRQAGTCFVCDECGTSSGCSG